MYQSDDAEDSGNELNGENRAKLNSPSYWGVVYKNRRQTYSAVGGMINKHVQNNQFDISEVFIICLLLDLLNTLTFSNDSYTFTYSFLQASF